MTEQEAIEIHIAENIHRIEVIEDFMHTHSDDAVCRKNISVLSKINGLLQMLQQYREIGLTPMMIKDLIKSEKQAHNDAVHNAEILDEYMEIGTVEDCRAVVEKQAEKKVFVVVQGNYALSKNMDAFSTRELAEGFRKHIRKESDYDGCINIFELEVDGAVLKEEDM